MPTPKVNWIPEEQAMERLGFSDREVMRRHIRSGELNIAYTQVNQKAKRFYNSIDIDRVLLEKSTIVAA